MNVYNEIEKMIIENETDNCVAIVNEWRSIGQNVLNMLDYEKASYHLGLLSREKNSTQRTKVLYNFAFSDDLGKSNNLYFATSKLFDVLNVLFVTKDKDKDKGLYTRLIAMFDLSLV